MMQILSAGFLVKPIGYNGCEGYFFVVQVIYGK